jgi:4-hydroxy-2-oxoheptanedioate aldolase
MKNLLKEKLESGKPALGTFAMLGPKPGAECLALGGMDFMIVDTEHGPFDVETAIDYVVAAERHGVTPLVRVKDPSRASVLKMLDIGAMGLIIPFLETVGDVRKLVEYG